MSRGPGKVEQAIIGALEADRENAFTVADLCLRAYPGANRIEKKHSVAVLRALKSVLLRSPGYALLRSGRRGNAIAVVDSLSPISIGMAALKLARLYRYSAGNSGDPRKSTSEAALKLILAPGGGRHNDTLPGGMWWLSAEMNRAIRDADFCRQDELQSLLCRKRMARMFDNAAFGGSRTVKSG